MAAVSARRAYREKREDERSRELMETAAPAAATTPRPTSVPLAQPRIFNKMPQTDYIIPLFHFCFFALSQPSLHGEEDGPGSLGRLSW